MEKEIKELGMKLKEHERRIEKLESIILSESVPPKPVGKTSQDVVKIFKELNLEKYDFVHTLSGIHLFLTIIHIAKEELGIDGVSPSEISQICKEKIRISKGVARPTVSDALSKAGAKVDRIENPRGSGFVYKIMKAGEMYIQRA